MQSSSTFTDRLRTGAAVVASATAMGAVSLVQLANARSLQDTQDAYAPGPAEGPSETGYDLRDLGENIGEGAQDFGEGVQDVGGDVVDHTFDYLSTTAAIAAASATVLLVAGCAVYKCCSKSR